MKDSDHETQQVKNCDPGDYFLLFSRWRLTQKASLFGIAPGAMEHRRRVMRPRHDWPDRDAQYIENQLKNFGYHRRDNPFSKMYMWNAAANFSPATAHDLAFYFSTLSPKAANDGNQGLGSRRKNDISTRNADSNIAACVVCHGPNAEGVGEIPRLGGLSYSYLKRRLEQWGEGYHAAARSPMPRIASKLSANQIEALASYLSFVK